MAQQIIDIDIPDSGNGDPLYDGGDKINDNFTELYNAKNITIGTGGDFANIGAAIAAGAISATKKIIQLISDISETGDSVIDTVQDFTILGNSFTIAMGNWRWYTATLTRVPTIYNATITSAKTDGGANFATAMKLIDCVVNCTGVVSGTVLSSENDLRGCTVNLKNAAGGAFITSVANKVNNYQNNTFVGSGSSCSISIYGETTASGRLTMSGNYFSGTYSSSSGINLQGQANNNYVNITGQLVLATRRDNFNTSGGAGTGNRFSASAGIVFSYQNAWSGNMFFSPVTTTGNEYCNLSGNIFRDTCNFSNGEVYASSNRFIGAITSSVTFHSDNNYYASTITNSGTTFHSNDRIIGNASYTGSVVCSSTVFAGTFTATALVRATGSAFNGNSTVSSTSNISTCTMGANFGVSTANVSINIQGCVFGAGLAGGGTSTLTLNSGVNRAIITGNQFDNAIVDNSGSATNTIANNITY